MEVKPIPKDANVVGRILELLNTAERDLCVSEIAEMTQLSRVSVHYSVKALKELGKIRLTRKVGKISFYELSET
ncbi:MAG: winged helix-turn-helix domain-containing protein [Candidatus Heimdallarchaeota archaeon]